MDFDQAIELLTALGDFGNLLTGVGDALVGVVEFGGSVEKLASGS
ncbi:hypothetical protein RHCRD62_40154 [Rhodococcus sp. RD6.2]|nr:hypothetical protein [Rhodococcus sp. RD6.2]CRK52267.1 hypothetical protein RHCRD62_40154 [Rhodococcus sp. RD6.2]